MNCKSHYFHSLIGLILNFISLSTISLAAPEKGGESHGGDAVACFDRPYFLNNGKVDAKAKLLHRPEFKDFWEFSRLVDFKLINLKDDLYEHITYKELADFIIAQIAKVDPPLFYRLAKKFSQFQDVFRFAPNSVLQEVNDSNSQIKPDANSYCYEVQLAIFEKSSLPGHGHTVINQGLFSQMSELDKAGLIIHELLWFEFAHNETKIKNLSYYVRYLTFLLFTKHFTLEPFFEYFYLKNLYLSGIYDLMKRDSRDRFLISQQQLVIRPAKNYSYRNSEIFMQLELQFNGDATFHLPNEIWEPGKFRDITPHKAEQYRTCINLQSDDLKHYGPCL